MSKQFKRTYLTSPLTTFIDKNGVEKKSTCFPPKWNDTSYILSSKNKDLGNGSIIACGSLNDIIVLDFDKKEGSDYDPYVEMCKIYPNLINHYTVKTRRGYHVYFKYDPTLSSPNLPGVDFQTEGKGIFSQDTPVHRCDGSIFRYKKFNKIETIEPLPQVIIDMCETKQGEHKISDYTSDTNYIYDITDDQILDIITRIFNEKTEYFMDYSLWLKTTTILKTLDKIDIWDDFNKKFPSAYNKRENLKIWNSIKIKISINFFCKILGMPCVKFHKVVDEEVFDDMIIKSKCFPINMKYISLKENDFQNHDVIILSSGTGTGKTTCVANAFKQYHDIHDDITILSIANLISLCKQQMLTFQSKGIDLLSYQDVSLNKSLLMVQNSVICINSLHVLSDCDFSNKIIYIDEIYALLNGFDNNHTMKYEKLIFNTLVRAINECHKIILSDAHIYNCVIKLLHTRVNLKETKYLHYINSYQKFKDVKAIKYNDENNMYNRMFEKVLNGESFVFACDSKTVCTEWYNYLYKEASIETQKRMILYTSETDNKILDEWDDKFVFYSPKISTGVDITTIQASEQFIHISGNSVSSITLFQMATRCRNMTQLNYYSGSHCKKALYSDISDCKSKELKLFRRNHLALSSCDDNFDASQISLNEAMFFEISVCNKYIRDIHNTDICHFFEEELKRVGFYVDSFEDTYGKLDADIKTKMEELTQINSDEKFNLLINTFQDDETDISIDQMKKRVDILKLKTGEQLVEYKDIIENEHKFEHFLNYSRLNKTEQYCDMKLTEISKQKMRVGLHKNIWNKIKYIHLLADICNIKDDLFNFDNINITTLALDKKTNDLFVAIKQLYNKRDKCTQLSREYVIKTYKYMLDHCISKLGMLKSVKSTKRDESRDKMIIVVVKEVKKRYDDLIKIMEGDKFETPIHFLKEEKEEEEEEEEEDDEE